MLRLAKRFFLTLLGAIALVAISSGVSGSPAHSSAADEATTAIACRVLETHTSQQPAVTLVLFHQAEAKDRDALAAMLREYSESSAEFQTSDGRWHSATVVRLKSCFGRGVLIFPAGPTVLPEKSVFALRFPGH
jgi:hypothetical protein